MKSKNNKLDKNKTIDNNINQKSNKATLNTLESQRRGLNSPEPSIKKISKKKIRRKIYEK